ncbi:unnamed protein product [Trifolium pratense]|uniref:Uncharacterized protein n=1 Tax=Trifolium pratense TaxID=57577 RepID=A0ACB0J0Z3_TRIPR|nr:unnamed protein product [Trifolium pratense]
MEKGLVCSAFDDIADLVPGKERVRIKARIVRLWKVPAFLNPNESGSIELVLVDHKGGKIHASVRKQLIHVFETRLEEGRVYEFSDFSVFPQSGSYRTTLHQYKIGFQLKTVVVAAEEDDISQFGIKVTSLAEIVARTDDYEYLVNVIGLMTGISAEREYVRDGKLTKMVVIELTDDTGKCECALFGEYADELTKKMGKSAVSGLSVVVVQFAKVKIFRDKASLQNVHNTTRILINPDIAEVEAFRNSIAVHGIDTDLSVSMIGDRPRPTFEEEFLHMHPKKSIAELKSVYESGIFVVCAEVVRVVNGHDWWYPACKCHKAVVPDSGSYFCSSCDRHVFHVIPRFRVRFEVTDGKDTCVFAIFDSDMSYMMEKSCAFFVAQSKGKIAGPYPNEFDSLAGKKMLFVVDKSANQSIVGEGGSRVRRVCMDSAIIAEFCAGCGYSTPVKGTSPSVDIDSDGLSGDLDGGVDGGSLDFVKELIVTPPTRSEVEDVDSDAPFIAKRNLSKAFDGVAKPRRTIRLKKVKIEKE